MQKTAAVAVLFLAALLEAGGDALVRSGLRTSLPFTRFWLWLAGALFLFLYGWTVNAPPWDFGKLLGMYIVFFFVVAQIVSIVAFGQWPARGVWLGGALIVSGGVVIALANG
jgi:hypothetical protein